MKGEYTNIALAYCRFNLAQAYNYSYNFKSAIEYYHEAEQSLSDDPKITIQLFSIYIHLNIRDKLNETLK